MDTPNTELIRSHVDTIILCTLLDGDSYPYDILKEISDKTEERYNLKQATLYSCMKRLEKKGLVSSYWGTESSGGRRRYYSLTDAGREFVQRDQTEWEYSRTIINRLLSDKEFDLEHGEAPFDVSALRPLTRRESHEDTEDIDEEISSVVSDSDITDENINASISEDNIISVDSHASSSSNSDNDDLLVSTPYMQHKDKSYSEGSGASDDERMEEIPSIALADILSADVRDDEPTDDDVRMLEASKRLNIGKYSLPYKLEEINENELVPVYDTSAATVQKQKSVTPDEDYIKKLDDLFTAEMTQSSSETEEKPRSNVQFNDLKNNLLKEGYRLRMYSRPTDISRFYQQYIYENKLRRDSYLILSLPLIVMAIVTLCLNIYSLLAVKIILGIGVFGLPIVSTIVCSLNIDKRVRNNYLFMYDFIIRLVISLIAIVIMLVVFFTVPSIDIASNTAIIYMSVAYALTVPLYSVIKALLLKTKRYYV